MALIGTISGSNGESRTAISGTVIIADRSVSSFPSFPGSDVSFFVSGTTGIGGSSGKVSVFGGDLVVSGTLSAKGAVTASAGVYATGDVLDVSGSFLLTGSAFVTGFVSASALTGSLTKLADGTSYIIAGTGINVVSASSITITLSNTGSAGTYGSSTQVPVFSTDAQGRVTNVTNTSISGVPPGGAAGGDLGGTYPNPSVTKLQGNNVSIATPADGQVLAWNGTAWVPGSIPTGGSGGGGVVYFLNYDVNGQNTGSLPVGTKQLGRTASSALSSVTSSIISIIAYDYIAGFLTNTSDPGLTTLPAGIWDFNIWAKTDANQPNDVAFIANLFKSSSSGISLLGSSSSPVYMYQTTELFQYATAVTIPQTSMTTSDRLYIELSGSTVNGGGSHTITFAFGDGSPSHVHTTVPSVAGTGIVHVINGVMQSPASPVDFSAGASEITGTLPIINGGTGLNTSPANGQLLIGNGTGYSQSTLTQGTGILVNNGAGSVTVGIDDSVVATISGSTFSGAVKFNAGLSGSLTKLSDGTSYIIASTGMSVTSASNGAVTLSVSNIPTSSISGFPFNDGGNKLATTASIAFSGGQGWNYFANNVGSDVIFYVSGAITNHNTTVTDRKRSIFGGDVVISGSLTQGDLTRADLYAVSMGSGSAALAKYSHAEGEGSSINSAATGSHAEGFYTITTGSYAHAEGFRAIARGNFSHAEGSGSITATTAQFSHAEGNTTVVSSLYGHAEGELTLVLGKSAHAEGLLTTASNSYSHAEGNQARATGAYAHAEGALTVAFGTHSHAEGNSSTTNASNSHAEGFNCITSTAANYSHAEGYYTTTFVEGSHSEGHTTTAYGDYSHAEGFQSSTSGSYSHAEGRATQTTGSFAHAEGDSTRAIGYASHAEGQSTVASGSYSHAAGIFTVASGSGQSVVGKYNLLNNDFSSFVIGNGVSTAARSDIMRVNTDDVQITGSLVVTTGSVSLPYAAKTTTYNIGSMDYLVDCTSGTFTVTLPTAVGITGRIYIIKNSGAGTITISTTSSQTIDGTSPPITLSTQYQVYSVMSNGSNWIKLQ